MNSWTADIARSTMLLSDSSDKSTSSHTSSNSSSSSSKSSRHSKSSPQVAMKSPPQRCQPLYSTATKLNSPANIEIFPHLQHHLQHPLQHPPPHLHLQYQPIITMLIFLGKWKNMMKILQYSVVAERVILQQDFLRQQRERE